MNPENKPGGEIVYRFHGALYINLTNTCPNACVFCIKRRWDMKFYGNNLDLLGTEPSAREVLERVAQLEAEQPASGIVFCGYGEPTMRLEQLIEVARELKKTGHKTRLNTVGLGSLVWNTDVPAKLDGIIDIVNVSLNSSDPQQWAELVRPLPQYREQGFEAVKEFVRSCARHIPDTSVSVVDLPQVNLPAAQKLAKELGATLRVRPYLDAAGKT